MSGALYFDANSGTEVSCAGANTYCVADWDACGGEAAVKGYFATTACCETESKIKTIIIVENNIKIVQIKIFD